MIFYEPYVLQGPTVGVTTVFVTFEQLQEQMQKDSKRLFINEVSQHLLILEKQW